MTKSFVINTLAIIFLIATVHITGTQIPNDPPSYYQIVIEAIFGKTEQQQDNSDQAPDNITAQDYIAQFRADLNGTAHHNRIPVIPWHEVNEMAITIKQELRNTNLHNVDKTNQIIRSVLLNHVKTKTIADLNELQREGYYIAPDDYTTIPDSHEYSMLARLNRMPHLKGESIAHFFGEHRKNSTKKYVIHRGKNNNPFDPSQGAHE